MPTTRRPTPPLTPVRLAGLAARPLPPVLLQPGLSMAMHLLAKRHPRLLERLSGLGAPRFLVDPVDLPFAFLLETGPGAPHLSAVADRDKADIDATAVIRGPLLRLVDLLEGRVDGDALFFTRDLTIEGETEAVVALRNAVDDAEIDIRADLLSPLGPLAEPARRVLDRAESLVSRAVDDLEKLRRAMTAPAGPGSRRVPSEEAEPPLQPQPKPQTRQRVRRTPDPGREPANVMTRPMELVCPAGTPASLRAAVDAGGNAVYLGFRDETNARNFPGLNFSREELAEGIAYAHDHGSKVLVAVNTYPSAGNVDPWRRAVDDAARLGADAVILADIGLADYARTQHPDLRRHLSVQASASNPEAIRFYHEEFGVRRVVLPRVLTVDEIAALNARIPVETEVFVFGGLCVMAEGRCALSGYATPCSPNREGVCSPAAHVRYVEDGDALITKLGEFTVNAVRGGEPAAYPTTCKGRYRVAGKAQYLFEEPASLSAMQMLPELAAAGVTALKIEGRQRGRAYVAQAVSAFRRAVDAVAAGEPVPVAELAAITEGGRETSGAYKRAWQ